MVPEEEVQSTTPSAELVGNAFVQQYYHILHDSPESVYRFYQDSSVLSRPDSDGEMKSVTTMRGINEMMVSLNFKDLRVEIKTADSQYSYKKGVIVLVTGCLTDKANVTRSFVQSFFLAPQVNGYYVLNDIFRYIEDREPSQLHPVNGGGNVAAAVTVTPEPAPVNASDPSAPNPANAPVNEGQIVADEGQVVAEERQIVAEDAYEPSNNRVRQIPDENEDTVEPHVQTNKNDDSQAAELDSSAQEDAPKKSYASIVKVPKGSPGPAKIYVPTNTVKTEPNKPESQPVESVVESAAVPEAAPLDSVANAESGDNLDKGEGYFIYVRNLPFRVTNAQLEEEFKKFGPIKPGGIQIRNNKQQGYCFGFIEFQSPSSMNNAIQASPINFAGRQAVVEMKKGSRGGGGFGRARIPPRIGGFRNENFRPRGNYGGSGRGFGRNDYGNHGEFSGRGRGPGGHVEGYQQGRGGRGGRPSAPKPNAVVSL